MELSERKKQILRAVVENYIQTAEPVGSKAIVVSAGLKVSSATIRNEMAELETLGYLEQDVYKRQPRRRASWRRSSAPAPPR